MWSLLCFYFAYFWFILSLLTDRKSTIKNQQSTI